MKNMLLPPAVYIDGAAVAMVPLACPYCKGTLYARDFERLADGYRLVCGHCGADIQRISEDQNEDHS
jgi:ribosomal protein S27AE